MEKHLLSKSTFIRGNQCLKSLYLNKKRPFLRDRLSPEQLAKFKRGHRVGELAQQLFPGGTDLKPKSPSQYRKKVLETAQIILTDSYHTLYEPAFQYDRLLILLDILHKENGNWTAYEVKSSLHLSQTYLLDAAFQYYVITNQGILLKDFFLVYVNKDYDFSQSLDINKLFIKESVLDRVLELQNFIREQVIREKETLLLEKSPPIAVGPHCTIPYPCDFIGHCWKKIPKEDWPVRPKANEGFYDFLNQIPEIETKS
ncbi:MAG: hypothetical protein DRI89_09780 [Bacteroidetes bacterium]|nr:MAG: hypothetical protein DRI89_09780 [Bacteroidota bacterium]